jgi:hypothetical protein
MPLDADWQLADHGDPISARPQRVGPLRSGPDPGAAGLASRATTGVVRRHGRGCRADLLL